MSVSPLLFINGDVPLAARVYRDTDDLFTRQPAVLITGSWLTVKEQMAHHYATALAARGYTVFTFDFAGFGGSGGNPRQAEIPARKIADITEAARFVSSLSYVHPGGVGYLAVCASAQYALAAIAGGAPIASFASVAGWYHDTASVAPFYGGAEGVALRMDRARAAFDAFLRTGEVRTVPAYQDGNDRAGMFFELDYYANPGRGAIPEWTNEMAELSWMYWLTFDGLSAAAKVSAPTLFVHGDDCVLPDNVKTVHDRLSGPTELVWADGSQIDFYDRPAQVSLAVEAADNHFRRTLPA
ncbi:MAG TPA: alpha/beta hydrolase [Actinophytocola sp.]|uniref:alpha/beta hydrolase n=1 Tax=Actinophytocola sp. TaxID=1872138 RepID=UPI002DDD871E|nr:alpha/beta hydrolase [Actinophytocola sp.]HEV2779897.1 alpha/beta hydrolase [Actinophytocola sp.]